jgi:hypothetical protein
MEMLLRFLSASKAEKKAIAIRTEELDWDEAHVGYVIFNDGKCVLLEEIDSNGRAEGQIEIDPKMIISIDYNDRYLKRLTFLNSNGIELDQSYNHVYTGEGIMKMLKGLKGSSKICTLFFEDDFYVTGVVLDVDNVNVEMHNIGVEGDDDGNSVYFLDQIQSVRYNSIEELKLEKLFKSRSNFY